MHMHFYCELLGIIGSRSHRENIDGLTEEEIISFVSSPALEKKKSKKTNAKKIFTAD